MSSVINYKLQSAEEEETNKDLIFKLNRQFVLPNESKIL